MHLEESLTSIASIVSDSASAPSDTCLLCQYEERTSDINCDLLKTCDDLHQMELADDDKHFELQDSVECQVFDCSVTIKKLLSVSGPSELLLLHLMARGSSSLN